MNEKVKSEKRIPSVAESIIGLLLVSAAVLIGLKLGIGSQMALFLGAIVAILVALFFRVPWSEIQATFYKTMSDSLIPIVILMIVGVTVGAWIIGGTVPSLMYFGLKLVSPKIILPLTFVLCAFMAVFTGTSFGSVATMGLALTGVAMGMGMPVPMVVGAVVSGAWFGDKLSPMSDSTNLASAMTGVNLYTHIGSMMWTTIPATIITIVIYTVIGLGYSTENVDMSNINLMLTTLDETFHISIIAIIPAIMMLVVSVLKIPAILGLSGVAVFSIVFAMLMQGVEIAGFEQTGIPIRRGTFMAESSSQIDNMETVFAGGDCVTGPATAIRAIAAGKVAAANIDEQLGFHHEIRTDVEIPAPHLDVCPPRGRVNTKEREAAQRKCDFEDIECGMTHEEACAESGRCLRCDHFGYGIFKGGRTERW